MSDESPEEMLRSVLRARLREGAALEAIRDELAAYGLSAEQFRTMVREESADDQSSQINAYVAMLPFVFLGLGIVGLGILYLLLDGPTMAMLLVAIGSTITAISTVGLFFCAMVVSGLNRRQNVLRQHQPGFDEKGVNTTDRYLYLFGALALGAILMLVGRAIDPEVAGNLRKKLRSQLAPSNVVAERTGDRLAAPPG